MTNQTTVYLYDPQTGINHNITSEVYSVDISRGRNRELDEINAGTCRVRCRNYLGNFNPYFLTNLEYLLLESGDFLLQEDGSRLLLEGIGTGGSFGVMTIGRKLTVFDGGIQMFTGFLEDIDLEWTAEKYKDATLICADGLARLARQSFEEWTATAGQTTGQRLGSIYARSDVDVTWVTSVDTHAGQSMLQGDTIANGTNVLTYCQDVNRAERGRFFVNAAGYLTFQDRLTVAAGVASCDFNDSASYANGQTAGKIPFSVVGVTFGAELLYTKVTVENIGGVVQSADDLTAQANYGLRTLALTQMLLSSDGQADDMGEYLLTRYASPEAVVSEIRVPFEKLSAANRITVATLDIGNTVTLNWTPTPGLGVVSQTLVVEGTGYARDYDGATWATFQLSAAPTNNFFILDTSQLDIDELGF